MDKNIPIYFDSVIVSAPMQEISSGQSNIGRLKVGVFTKYGNRNGSYITDAVAEQMINSAIEGSTPVVGFFDPSTKQWASHTGPTLANAYGYIESFEGWEPLTDTDGITRDYAIFSVILFTDYFEEAQKILGQHQSMELDVNSITGDWANIDGEDYYVYTTARIIGLCIIGDHEPCFSVSSFFSKQDASYTTQYEKFALLLEDLKERVRKGGETVMDEQNNQEQVISEEVVEFEAAPEVVEESAAEEPVVEETAVEEPAKEETAAEPVVEEFAAEELAAEEPAAVDPVQAALEELKANYNSLQESYNNASNLISQYEADKQSLNEQINALTEDNAALKATLAKYEAEHAAAEAAKKEQLVEKYAKILVGEEEISDIRAQMNNFSYDELEGKLAVLFANQALKEKEEQTAEKIPLVEQPVESQFALLMKKYRKN